MNSSLAEQYFSKALDSAKKSELSAALRFASLTLGLAPADEKAWRLAGLCYYQLGNYEMAQHCFGQLTKEREDWQTAILKKQEETKPAITLTRQGKYKKAAAYLAAADKTIGEWNYLGCLYAVLGQKDKAAGCFVTALKMDHSNADARDYLSGLEQRKKRRWWSIWR